MKGQQFERDFCRDLSRWFTKSRREDVFWRSAASGARGTVRGRAGKTTAGACGDICATDPIGQPLLDLITFELKRGYSKHTLFNVVDKGRSQKTELWEQWLIQAMESQSYAGSFSWMIVHRRDRREPFVFFPTELYKKLRELGAFEITPNKMVKFRMQLETLNFNYDGWVNITAMSLEEWFDGCQADHIRQAARLL